MQELQQNILPYAPHEGNFHFLESVTSSLFSIRLQHANSPRAVGWTLYSTAPTS